MKTKLNQEQKLWQPSDLKQGMTVWQNTTFYLLTTVCCADYQIQCGSTILGWFSHHQPDAIGEEDIT